MKEGVHHSVRSRLLVLLLSAVVLTACVQAFVAYRTSLDETNEIFDYQMQQMALSLRPGLPTGSDPSAGFRQHLDDSFEFIVQVTTASGEKVFQSNTQATFPPRSESGFSTFEARGTTYKLYTLVYGSQRIQIAQDRAARRGLARTLALRTTSPVLVMVPLLMALVWWVVSSSLAPLNRVQRQIAQRQADALQEVEVAGLPDEVRPLVEELNLLFRRMRHAFTTQKNFVADAAHELRSPLAALKLQWEQLRRSHADKDRELALARLGTGIDRATRLAEQLLVLARQQSGQQPGGHPHTTDLAKTSAMVLHDMAYMAGVRQVQVQSQCQQAVVPGDPEALRIMVSNLLDNAIKYTPAGGTVLLAASVQGSHCVLTVDDSGPGIPAADRERVWDRFYRVPGAQGTGSGLGLAIVKTIVDTHAGSVVLDTSAALGGLRVTVRLPAAQAQA